MPVVTTKNVPPGLVREAERVMEHLGLACKVTLFWHRPRHITTLLFTHGATYAAKAYTARQRRLGYIVWLNSCSDDKLVRKTIAHEMRHVWQMETGRLAILVAQDRKSRIAVRWAGRPLFLKAQLDMEYENLPWEVDARAFATGWIEARHDT